MGTQTRVLSIVSLAALSCLARLALSNAARYESFTVDMIEAFLAALFHVLFASGSGLVGWASLCLVLTALKCARRRSFFLV